MMGVGARRRTGFVIVRQPEDLNLFGSATLFLYGIEMKGRHIEARYILYVRMSQPHTEVDAIKNEENVPDPHIL